MVWAPGTASQLDMDSDLVPKARFLRRIGKFCRLIRFDKRGTGLSDREDGDGVLPVEQAGAPASHATATSTAPTLPNGAESEPSPHNRPIAKDGPRGDSAPGTENSPGQSCSWQRTS
jgi:hypothetical protein